MDNSMEKTKEIKISDGEILTFLDGRFDDFTEHPTDVDLLTYIFQAHGGMIFFNEENKLAVGFFATKRGLMIFFFDIIAENKLKCINWRGFPVTDDSEHMMHRALEICKLMQKNTDAGDDSFYG